MTTDTAAALRAAEIEAEVFLKATKVDGVFDCDPVKNAGAKLHRQLSFRQVMVDNLKVMDETAITLCKENDVKVELAIPESAIHSDTVVLQTGVNALEHPCLLASCVCCQPSNQLPA